MLFDMLGNPATTVHKICISNYTKDKFISTYPNIRWTDNLLLATCFDDEQEVLEFVENQLVQDVIGDELELYIWTDTKTSIYEVIV